MLKTMRSASAKSNLFGEGLGSEIFMQMFDQGLADKMSESGQIGVANSMYAKYAALVDGAKSNGSNQEGKPVIKPIKITAPVAAAQKPTANEVNPIAALIPAKSTPVTVTSLVNPIVEKPVAVEADLTITPVFKKPVIEMATSPRQASTKAKSPVDRFHSIINEAATAHQVDPNLVKAVIFQESGGNPKAVSAKGAKGLMQLMDGTSKMLGISDPFDIKQNIAGGVKYLADLLKKFEGNIKNALAAYNAGPAAVEKYGGVPPYDETTEFVDAVMAHFNGLFKSDKSR